jgi:hypothetical protein
LSVPRKPAGDPSKYYVDKKKLLEAIREHRVRVLAARAAGAAPPRASDFIGLCIMKICSGLSHDRHFRNYSQHWREDMVSDGIADCVAAVDNFDPEKSENPFGYFTQIAFNANRRRIDRERRQQYVKHKNMQRLGIFEHDPLVDTGRVGPSLGHSDGVDASRGIIESYEETIANRKMKKEDRNNDEEDKGPTPRPRGRFGRGRKAAEPDPAVEPEADVQDEG